MNRARSVMLSCMALIAIVIFLIAPRADHAHPVLGKAEIEAFNQRFIRAHLKMDNVLVLSFWADDGVSLMPDMAPIIGKSAINKVVEEVVASTPDYRVTKEEIDFHDIQVSSDWASEWGLEHQIAQGPPGKPTFDGHGKILLVLHRDAHGDWRIQQEMWNSAPKE
jgi:ketosteroid isomerase-like protein